MMRSMIGWWTILRRKHTIEIWATYLGFGLDVGEIGSMQQWCRENLPKRWSARNIDHPVQGTVVEFSFAERGDLAMFALMWSEQIAALKARKVEVYQAVQRGTAVDGHLQNYFAFR